MSLKRITVVSPYPNLDGVYVQQGESGGKAAFCKEKGPQAGATWLFHSAIFGRGPCWYFGRSLPSGASMSSFCASAGDAASPELAEWPSTEVTAMKEGVVEMTAAFSSAAESCRQEGTAEAAEVDECEACKSLQALHKTLRCGSCSGDAQQNTSQALLLLLRAKTTSATLQRLANALASGDVETKALLDVVVQRSDACDRAPLIVAQPPASVELSSGSVTLNVEAVSLAGDALTYQWFKDNQPLTRAERPRYMLVGAGPLDEGSYNCLVSAGGSSSSTRACEIRLAASEKERRSRYEAPLLRAAEAEQAGDKEAAVRWLSQAFEAAAGQPIVQADAVFRRASLQLALRRFEEAFRDASDAVKLSPGMAKAHAVRARAACELGRLAEAVSSWETADLLGGVPEAARQAEECRQRLRAFFAERQSQRKDCDGAGRASQGPENDDGNDWEESWRQNGWQGRYAGGGAGGFFGGGGSGYSHRSSGGQSGGAPGRVPADLQKHLSALGLPATPLPSADVVRSAYRRLALQAHPDKPGGSKTAFQELQNAYEAVLQAVGS
eukprot:TRINITY_DN121448_c0_g1_i1.p1 TRINITY_DN121448_c0_g1~~TRINITY_DN121448_c0_g1_i1.p1  ORF type:complete len:576 (+),score=105.27 TRINITY_DN121448_c0_g1_i1:69-1730(+)